MTPGALPDAVPVHPLLSHAAIAAFAICWGACVAGWVIALLDHGRLRRQDPRAPRRGLPVLRFQDPALWQPRDSAQLMPFSTASGHVIPIDAESLGFYPALGGALTGGLRGLLHYSGLISWKDGPAQVSVRAPYGLPVFVAAWITAWLVFALALGPAVEGRFGLAGSAGVVHAALVQCLPALAVLAIAGAGWLGIRRRGRALYDEVRARLREGSGPAPS